MAKSFSREDDGLGVPRPIAWGYIQHSDLYDHALRQWQSQLNAIAQREGYAIDKWFTDSGGRTAAAEMMLQLMPGSGVAALFLPDPTAMWALENYNAMDRRQLGIALNRPIYVISESHAPIFPTTGPLAQVDPPRNSAPRWCRWRGSRPRTT